MSSLLASLSACISIGQDNPQFQINPQGVDAEWARMERDPKPNPRPLILLSGYRSPSIPARRLADKLARLTGTPPDRTLVVSYPFLGDMAPIVAKASRTIDATFPSDSPDTTVEVDVVAISMGGLVARAAAADSLPSLLLPPGTKRVAVKRLFTLATPHQGASLADFIAPDPAAAAMIRGSTFLQSLDAALPAATYELTCYARLRDGWVGATRSAPPGLEPIWSQGLIWGSHFTIHEDRKIITDMARRLRNEPPLAHPGFPPPHD